MTCRLSIVLVLVSVWLAAQANAQPPLTNSEVASIVRQVSARNIIGYVDTLSSFGTRHTLSDTSSSTRGIGAARRWLRSEFERSAKFSDGRMSVAFDDFIASPSGRIPRPVRLVNVVATLRPEPGPVLPGERMIVIGGHYDSRATSAMDSVGDAPGADDDGSGTALVLELARVFSRHRVKTTMLFACFAGEEQGLLGSAHLAEEARQKGWNVEAVLSNDIIGNTEGGGGSVESTYVRVFSEAFSPLDTGRTAAQINALGLEEDGPSRSLARYIKETAERYVPGFSMRLVYRRDRFLRGGDHTPFHQRGFAAVRFSEAVENFSRQHHDPDVRKGIGDLPQYVNARYCASVARANAAVAATLALAPPAPQNARIVVAGLDYGTTLHWQAGPDTNTAGYLVRWRETTSPVWQKTFFTRDSTVHLNVSKDDYLFGVQAVDREGNSSLVAIPIPDR